MASEVKDDGLKKLEYLSLVSKVCTELESHVDFLAEFLIELGRDCESVDVFYSKLKENGAEMLDYFVRTLFTIIHASLPPNVNKSKKGSDLKKGDEGCDSKFPALNIRRRGLRNKDRNDGKQRDGYDEDGDESRDKSISGEPELYQVYKGRVQRVICTGCFVQLIELRGKEGLVHVSQMATRGISNAKDVVKRDQEVYVKVISISNQKLSLSMRDVDQNTGQDLLPLKKSSEDSRMMASEVKDDGLKKLEYLSLVSKVCTEPESHLGFGDKVLAEFITELGRDCETVDVFYSKLKENGAEMPDYFVRTLWTIIHAILPPNVNKSKKGSDLKKGDESCDSKFPVLNISDSRERVNELERVIALEAKEKQKRDGGEEERRYRERRRDDRGDFRGKERHKDRSAFRLRIKMPERSSGRN